MDKPSQPPPLPRHSAPRSGGIMNGTGMIELLQLGVDALSAKAARSTAMTWQPPSLETIREMLPEWGITRFIARGGMGVVYEGYQKALGRKVAVKILPPDLNDGGLDFAERFKAEAKALANLKHPGIVAIYHAGETSGGLLYFVMELVDGTDLAKLIESEKRLSPTRAIEITTAVCEALSYAHSQGVIHRDIKPSNILIDKRGRVMLSDFGLAKSLDASQTALTRSNVAVGTPEFLAPEATTPGCELDERADIYAVGVMLYQMLTGHLPRGGYKPVSSMVKEVNPCYDDIVDKAMQMNREDRYTTATELKSALERAQSHPSWMDSVKAIASPMAKRLSECKQWLTWSFWKRQLRWRFYALTLLTLAFTLGNNWQASEVIFAIAGTACLTLGTMKRRPRLILASLVTVVWLYDAYWPASPETATASKPFINSLGMEFVPVPGHNNILIAVRPTERKAMGRFDIETASGARWTAGFRRPSDPVLGLSWQDAVQFTQWLSVREGRSYRLPKQEEWLAAVAPCGYENGGMKAAGIQYETSRRLSTEPNKLGLVPLVADNREWCMPLPGEESENLSLMMFANSLKGDCAEVWSDKVTRAFTRLSDFSEKARKGELADIGFTFRCVLVVDGKF